MGLAFAFPILIFVIIAIAELGVAFKGCLTASAASREGARIAAFVGDAASADCQVVTGIAGILGANIGDLDRIEIYQVDQSGSLSEPRSPTGQEPCPRFGSAIDLPMAKRTWFATVGGFRFSSRGHQQHETTREKTETGLGCAWCSIITGSWVPLPGAEPSPGTTTRSCTWSHHPTSDLPVERSEGR